MFHHPHHYGWTDLAKRQQTEREHQKMPIEPMSFNDKAGLSIWITAGILALTCLVVGWLGVTGRI